VDDGLTTNDSFSQKNPSEPGMGLCYRMLNVLSLVERTIGPAPCLTRRASRNLDMDKDAHDKTTKAIGVSNVGLLYR
jgi:hypothetical protein